jgi:outer membrane protein assembly factor BamA
MRGMHNRSIHRTRFTSLASASGVIAWACMLLPGCASVQRHSYGVRSLEIQGTKHMDPEALKVCLATQARERTGFLLGTNLDPECNIGPFDATRVPVALWSWPWTEWPTYDEAVFDRDISRINRWYRARGFYDERVVEVTRKPDEAEHKIDLTVKVEEGEPILTEHIDLVGVQSLDKKLFSHVEHAIQLKVDERFDETSYDNSKRAIIDVVRDAAYAQASVEGKVLIDAKRRRARVSFEVKLGRRFRFGKVLVEGQGSLPKTPIRGAAQIEEGSPYSLSTLEDAKRAIYELGPFASVEFEEEPRIEAGAIDILIKVVPGRLTRVAVGLGMQAGVDPTLTPVDTPGYSENVWDLHLLGRIEQRNFLGGMRRVSIEERPRLIFNGAFPTTPSSQIGNLLIFEFKQPAFFESRTTFSATARWDLGPDPYGGNYSRSDFLAGMGPDRSFFDGKLRLAATININVFIPSKPVQPEKPMTAPPEVATPTEVKPNYYPNYFATYMQYTAVLDLRNDPREPRRGAYFGLTVQSSGYFLPSDWNYVRITPDVRGYVPLPLGMVLAGRAHIGIMEITDSKIVEKPASEDYGYTERLHDLGPLRQRLRGGGSNSVRGYLPNTLGDVFKLDNRLDSGGLRQWEASIELRAPITPSFGAVLFVDVGDVSANADKKFRFQYPQTTFGLGLRYKTLIGPIRLDAGFAPTNLQVIGADNRSRVAYNASGQLLDGFPESLFLGMRGALHFTIGEAF